MSICDLVLTFIKLDTGALYKKLSSKHDSCSKHQLSSSHKDKHQFLSIVPIPLEKHECNAVLQISIQYCSTTVSFVKINAVQAILQRWSRDSVLDFGTQVRGFKPGRSRRIFQSEKILSTPSFGGEVKPSVPYRRFKACKPSLNARWKSGISGKIHRPFLFHIVPPLATRISGETTSGESWNV